MASSSTSFLQSEHDKFVQLSGDNNPLHTDALAARRLMFGGAVVHGVHIVLRGLDLFLAHLNRRAKLVSLRARFIAPVSPSEPLDYEWREARGDETELRVASNDVQVATIKIVWISGEIDDGADDIPSRRHQIRACKEADLSDPDTNHGAVSLVLDRNLSRELFPRVTDLLPASQTAAIVATTTIVGMLCPGLHSVFSEMDLKFDGVCDEPELAYQLYKFDDRYNLATIQVHGCGTTGRLYAFERPRPQAQPAPKDLAGFVVDDEFAGQRVLVVGGSRGLGELATKLLALGGAAVLTTYANGEKEANSLLNEITAHDPDAEVSATQLDVTWISEEKAAQLTAWRPTRLLYFATPHIFRPRHSGFSTRIFDEFRLYYVSQFAELFGLLAKTGDLSDVIYPSSVAVEEVPKELLEYAAAKSAGEVVCAGLAKTYPAIKIRVPRLPRLPTDQTANVYGIKASDAVPILLNLFR